MAKLMSPKQRDTLSRLLDEKQIDEDTYAFVKARLTNNTTIKAASGLITMLLAAPDKPGKKRGVTKEGWFKHPKTKVVYNVIRSKNGYLIALGENPNTGMYTKWVRGVQFELSDADEIPASQVPA